MRHELLLAATLLASTAHTGNHFSIGPWVIVPILILAAIIAIPIYVMRDRRKRQAMSSDRSSQHANRE